MRFSSTNEQAADIQTKSLPRAKHDYFRLKLRVCDFEARGVLNDAPKSQGCIPNFQLVVTVVVS